MGPFNSRELHIRLSNFLWDALFGLQEGQGWPPDSPNIQSPVSDFGRIEIYLKFKAIMFRNMLETVLLGHRWVILNLFTRVGHYPA